jgi:hypothetical protein
MFTVAETGDAKMSPVPDPERREAMAQIIVTADRPTQRDDGTVMLRERVTVADFESDHFSSQLVERLGWAVCDACEVESDGREQRAGSLAQ